MPADTGMAFVIVQHLSPDFESHMRELLGRKTKIPISNVERNMVVKPDTIYLIPPGKEAAMANGRLLVSDREDRSFSYPIDSFLRTLAQDAHRFAIGIILSGTGNDGRRGITEIRDSGGLVIAQSEETSKFDGMPASARESGAVHVVLAPEEIPSAIIRYYRHALSPEALAEETQPTDLPPTEGVETLFALLRQQKGNDFSLYRSNTFNRRVQRRMGLTGYSLIEEYAKFCETNPEEVELLYEDLLIGVTEMFRDGDAFVRLGEIVEESFLERVKEGKQIRVWVAGCATGEEAYTIAILLDEFFREHKVLPNFKIFATDLHKSFIKRASAGIYEEVALRHLGPERLGRYFSLRDGRYHVASALRSTIVFAPHNLLAAAPFTRLDLLTCRNLLIYFKTIAQKKVLSLFHFSLRTGGLLFLGPSESTGEIADEFSVIDKRWKIYRKKRNVRLLASFAHSGFSSFGGASKPEPDPKDLNPAAGQGARVWGGLVRENEMLRLYDGLLDKFMPASLLVDERHNLVHSFAGAQAFLRVGGGRLSPRLVDLVREELRTPLGGALQQVEKNTGPVRYDRIPLGADLENSAREVSLTVSQIAPSDEQPAHFLVQIEEQTTAPTARRRVTFSM